MPFVLLLLLTVLGVPVLIVWTLFSRTRRLQRQIDDLNSRMLALEPRAPAVPRAQAPAPRVELPRPVPPIEEPRAAAVEAPAPPVEEPVQIAAPAAAREDTESLESRIGGRWLLNLGIAAIVIGVAYFEKLAIDKQWINETARVIQGGLLGAALIVAGGRFARRGYAFYGQMMAGGGVAILYLSTYAAFNYYSLIDRPLAYVLMIGITALGAWLADRHDSQGVAVLAVGGGFLTPFLLPGSSDAQIALFTYVAIMIAGTVYLARRRAWPLLNLVSYIFTLLTIAGWADRFYTPEKYLTTEIYLTVFCAMFVAIARSARRLESAFAEFASWFLWTAPFAYYFASQVVLARHPMALLVWLMGVAVLGGVLSVVAGSAIGFAVWIASALPLLAWTMPPMGLQMLPQGLTAVAALYAVGLASLLRPAGEHRPVKHSEIAWMHLDALLMFAGAYFLLEPAHLAITGSAAAAFSVWNGALAAWLWRSDRDRAVHFAALSFTLLSIAIALQFDGPAVTIGWAAEGAAIVALGLLERRGWVRAGGAVLFGIAFLRTLDLLLSPPPANQTVLLNPRAACAIAVAGLAYAIAWLHRREQDEPARAVGITAPILAAQVLSLVFLTTEIHAYFALRQAPFTRELLVSLTWAVYATILIVIGLQRRYAPVRYFAIALFGVTSLKVFVSDLAELERIYRVMSVIGLGVMLLLTSYLYQRMRRIDDPTGRI